MAKQPSQSLRIVEPAASSEPEALKTFAEPVLSPYDTARRDLEQLIKDDAEVRQYIAEQQAKHERAEEVLFEAIHDQEEAEKILKAAKSTALMNGTDWRGGTGVSGARATLADAQERVDMAREVRDTCKAEMERMSKYNSKWRKDNAINEIIRNHPKLPAFVAEACEKYRAFKEIEQVMNVIELAFPRHEGYHGIEGWSAIGDRGKVGVNTGERADQFRSAIAAMHLDAAADLPV